MRAHRLSPAAILNALATWRFFLLWAVVIGIALSMPGQSNEVFLGYATDAHFNPLHAVFVAFAVVYAGAVFAVSAVDTSKALQWPITTVDAGNRAVGVAALVPTALLGIGMIAGCVPFLHVGLIKVSAQAGVLAGIVLLLPGLIVLLWDRAKVFGVTLNAVFGSGRGRMWLAGTSLVLLAGFLILPFYPENLVTISQTAGSVPLLLVSLSLVMYGVHRFLQFTESTASGAWLWLGLIAVALFNLFTLQSSILASWFSVAIAIGVLAFGLVELASWRPSAQRAGRVALAIATMAIALTDIRDVTRVRTLPVAAADRATEKRTPYIGTAVREWLNKRTDMADYAGKPYPIYIVAAEGGGLYAAQHAAVVLAELQDRCPRFAHHVFAMSGVSGGSLGVSVFANIVAQTGEQPVARDCKSNVPANAKASLSACSDHAKGPSESARTFRTDTCAFLARDFLSPLVFQAVIPTLAQRVISWLPMPKTWMAWFPYDRALGLEYGFEAAGVASARTGKASIFGQPFSKQWTADGTQPALVLNTTRVDTGERYLISPFRLNVMEKDPQLVDGFELAGFDERTKVLGIENPGIDLRVSTSAALSARFPFVTPPGTIDVAQRRWFGAPQQSATHPIGLIDGGYYENSGLQTAMEMALTLKREFDEKPARADGVEIKVIAIGDIKLAYGYYRSYMLASSEARLPGIEERHLPQPIRNSGIPFGEVSAPLTGVLSARSRSAVESMRTMVHVGSTFSASDKQSGKRRTLEMPTAFMTMAAPQLPLPLGWQQTDFARRRIELRLPDAEIAPLPRGPVKTFEKSWTEKLDHYGEDVSLYPDLVLIANGFEKIRHQLSPDPTKR